MGTVSIENSEELAETSKEGIPGNVPNAKFPNKKLTLYRKLVRWVW